VEQVKEMVCLTAPLVDIILGVVTKQVINSY